MKLASTVEAVLSISTTALSATQSTVIADPGSNTGEPTTPASARCTVSPSTTVNNDDDARVDPEESSPEAWWADSTRLPWLDNNRLLTIGSAVWDGVAATMGSTSESSSDSTTVPSLTRTV